MKRLAFLSVLAVLSLITFTTKTKSAVDSGPSANGSFQFSLEDGNIRYVEFEARIHDNNARGTMTFTDPNGVVGDENGTSQGGTVSATFDCMRIEGNRAVMGGVVSSSSIAAAVGRRMLLVVEDNGEGVDQPTPDKLTWGVYEAFGTGWIPKDAERDDDNGASLTWIATDAERPDDVGIPSRTNPLVGCQSFPLSSYAFVSVEHGGGNIQIRP